MASCCINCEAEYEIYRNGVWVIRTRGLQQVVYKVYRADIYECPGCNNRILDYFGLPMFEEPVSEAQLKLIYSEEHYFVRESNRRAKLR